MDSGIYEGRVWHRRYQPVPHVFSYPLYLFYLDLDELDEVFRGRWGWSTRALAPVRFDRRDHLGPADQPLAESVRDLVATHLGFRPAGPIRLLTQLRHFGFIMNPVSFFYCFAADGHSPAALVAEVNNTPWGERHCYVLPASTTDSGILRHSQAKEFHVSPFMGMDQSYRWRVSWPGRHLSVRIENLEHGQRLFDATLRLHRRELNSRNLYRTALSYPLITAQVFAGIYWQAARLWWKGCPVYSHPGSLQPQEIRST